MHFDIDKLIHDYGEWLTSNTTYMRMGEWYEVNVPLLDDDNDYTQFYIKPCEDQVILSDDCATLRRLESHGVALTASRLASLDGMLDRLGVAGRHA